MGMLFDLLALMDDWKWINVDIENRVIQPSTTYNVIFEQNEIGWFIEANASFKGEGAENVEIGVEVDDLKAKKTLKQLYEAGYTQRGVNWIYLYQYDTTENLFSVGFEPGYPAPYNSLVKFTATTPSNTQATITTATFARVRVKESRTEEFKNQIKELLGTSGIGKIPIEEKEESLEIEEGE